MTSGHSNQWVLSGFGDEVDPDPRIQLAVLQALGATHIEVRSAWGTNVSELDDDQLARLGELVRAADFGVSAIASPIGKVDVSLDPEHEAARLQRVIRAAHALGASNIRIFSFYRGDGVPAAAARDDVLVRMRRLADIAEREGVTLLHENEKAIYGDVPERILDMVESVGSPALRLAWDNANFVQVGVRPFTDAYPALRPYVGYLQVKDAVAGTGAVVPTGEGDGQMYETFEAFRDSGFDGYVSLEPHLAAAHELGGFSGPVAFGQAARAFADLARRLQVELR